MEHTDLTPAELIRRIALPFFVFASVLAGLLLLSWFLLIPRLTSIEVSGVERNLKELQVYTKDLQAKISSLEQDRSTFLFSKDSNTYARLRTLKQQRHVYQQFRSAMADAIQKTVPERRDAIVISSYYYDATTRTIRVSGDVRNSGTRSMTVLASFVKNLEEVPMTLSVSAGKYTRLEDPEKGYYSPFTLHILLDHEIMGNT